MLSDSGLAALRAASTLTHMFPTLATLAGDGRCTRLEVSWPADPLGLVVTGDQEPEHEPEHQVVHPCAFRHRVAEAWSSHQLGRRLRLLDLDHDPSVELVARGGGWVSDSGIVCVPLVDQVVLAFATLLEPDACRNLGDDLLAPFDPPPSVSGVGLRADRETGVTVAYAELDAGATGEDRAQVVDLFEALMARFLTSELLADVTGGQVGSRW